MKTVAVTDNINKRWRIPKGQSKMDNPEKLQCMYPPSVP